MLPDRVSNPGPLTYESGALPIALRGPALSTKNKVTVTSIFTFLPTSAIQVIILLEDLIQLREPEINS